MSFPSKLPIGIQTFSEIIEGGYCYVDKTGLACRMLEEHKYYFLSRPRRFGKSLFLDTLKSMFPEKPWGFAPNPTLPAVGSGPGLKTAQPPP